MSFSSEVKAELAKNISSARHCRIAELSGMMSMVADVWYRNGSLFKLCITTERSIIAKTMAALIKVLFDIRMECSVKKNREQQPNLSDGVRSATGDRTDDADTEALA